ncbi:MAG: hypothetical protein IJE43_24230 [Alphaproteobacteria bacterium]|nr:hypothetical protein [Alphaproteobacteria bacterium]
METYIYLAEERINALYEQDGAGTIEESFSGGINTVVSATGEARYTYTDTLTERLTYVLSRLNTRSNNLYIDGNITMAWNAKNRIRSDIQSTFWIGEIPSTNEQIYDKTYILLIGSEKNIVSNRNVSDYYVSASYIDSFFKSVEDSFNEVTFQCHQLLECKNAERDEINIKAIAQRSDWSSEQKIKVTEHYLKQYDTNKYLEYLLDTYTGNYCECKFSAQILSSSLGYNNQNELCRFIIAAPLFVILSNIVTERVLYLPTNRKYVLTEKEYNQHKKNRFANLYYLLQNSGMKSEEHIFTSEMNAIFDKYKKHKGFKDKKEIAKFVAEVEPIVERFFLVLKGNHNS